MEDILLSIDCGTQSTRAILFDARGNLLDKVKIEYQPYFSKQPGWAEQDAEILWRSLCKGCKVLKSRAPSLFENIAGVGVTAQRDSMIVVDARGNPLRPIITWLDRRKAKPFYYPRGIMKLAYFLTGMNEAIYKAQTDGKCNWIRQNEPEIWEKTAWYLQVSGFLNHRLTGEFSDSIASQIGHIPFDYKRQKWAERGHLNSLVFPVEEDKLPKLVPPGSILGEITKNASSETGLREGIPVVACGSDKGCETLGMGVLNPEKASLSFGTTATVQTTTERYCEPLRFMPAYPAPVPGHFNPEVEIYRGYWMINWFKNQFAYREVMEAERRGVAPEILLNELLGETPPGAMGLVLQPYWSPGLKNPWAKGAIIGFGEVHTRAYVYRAVIEGLAFALLEGLKKIERVTRTVIKEVTLSGGASQSDQICQISADIFNLPHVRGKTFETAGLGAAIITAVGLGLHKDFESAVKEMVQYQRVFTPEHSNRDIYREIYSSVYTRMYRALSPLYKKIRKIAGYP
ncbi:MAG: carbohydrate kinase [Spirochaetes bacterium]|nr:MAG: carbohydrate kinase [Spirochaetota bacterium]